MKRKQRIGSIVALAGIMLTGPALYGSVSISQPVGLAGGISCEAAAQKTVVQGSKVLKVQAIVDQKATAAAKNA